MYLYIISFLLLFSVSSTTSASSYGIQDSFTKCILLHSDNKHIPFNTTFLHTPSDELMIQDSFTKFILMNSDIKYIPFNTTFIYTPNDSSYNTILRSTAQNLRCILPFNPKPLLIFTPLSESHVQSGVTCARKIGIHIRIRSGGHDYDGLSYTSAFKSPPPFILIDLRKLRAIDVNVKDNSVWVQSGATNGELSYRIWQKSKTHAVPTGTATSVGIGGHITGGAYGVLMRKYGLAVDNVDDARIVNADGEILDRKSMGEDLFWAITGGGGGSFGIILAWKLKMVRVPSIVTVFTVNRTQEEGATKILYKWQQIADKLDENLFIRVFIQTENLTETGNRTVQTSYNAIYLGRAYSLLRIMNRDFPEMGLTRNDSIEMSWIESVLYIGSHPRNTTPEYLLQAIPAFRQYFKAKSDFFREPVPEHGLEGLFKILLEEHTPVTIWNPFGGMMGRISESATPFPHRKGVRFMGLHMTSWLNEDEPLRKHFNWMRRLYSYLSPYATKFPRETFVNWRDLEIGMNKNLGNASFKQASGFGVKYFKRNFNRLVAVKTKVDPGNFFWHEQSIPTMHC